MLTKNLHIDEPIKVYSSSRNNAKVLKEICDIDLYLYDEKIVNNRILVTDINSETDIPVEPFWIDSDLFILNDEGEDQEVESTNLIEEDKPIQVGDRVKLNNSMKRWANFSKVTPIDRKNTYIVHMITKKGTALLSLTSNMQGIYGEVHPNDLTKI